MFAPQIDDELAASAQICLLWLGRYHDHRGPVGPRAGGEFVGESHWNTYLSTAFSSHSRPRPGPRARILPLSGINGSVRTAPARSRYSDQDAVGEQAIVCALASM